MTPPESALLSLSSDSLTITTMEDAAENIRFIDVCHSCNASELSMSIFAVCRYVDCIYASRIEPCFHLAWIPYFQCLTSISETEQHLAVSCRYTLYWLTAPQFQDSLIRS